MTDSPGTVLVVGATGSIGRLVVAEAIGQGYTRVPWCAIRARAGSSRRTRNSSSAT